MPETNSDPPPSATAAGDRIAHLGRCVALVVERVDRRGHDDRARPNGPDDVGERVVGADVARRRVHDRLRAGGQHGVDVVGGGDAERPPDVAEVAGVATDLGRVVHDDGGELEQRVGVDGADGGAPDVPRPPDDRGDHGGAG